MRIATAMREYCFHLANCYTTRRRLKHLDFMLPMKELSFKDAIFIGFSHHIAESPLPEQLVNYISGG